MRFGKPMIIAIDGPAGSGKGTLARGLADALNYAHLDTGKLYRCVGLAVLSSGKDPEDEEAALQEAKTIDLQDIDNINIMGDVAAVAASKVARFQKVRDELLKLQKDFANSPPGGCQGAVIDGRDIGTVVCANADFKFFITASAEVRAERRHKELLARGEPSIYARVLDDMLARDESDKTRSIAPLRPASDARVIDTSELDANTVLATALGTIKAGG